ncbi:MAG TPA: hypothetical protein VGC44_04610 [Longimicrobiales bacterium]
MNERKELSAGYGAIATAVIALLTYILALKNGFAFDDVVLIPNDARVINGQLATLLTTSYWNDAALALYRPLTSLSFGLDWALADGAAAWFHFTNVIWHALASTLVFVLLKRYFTVTAALVGGALFAVHPVHVEAVANVVGRAELMATSFVLAACILWPRIELRSARAAIVAVLYFLALCAKEGAVVLPALVMLVDFAEGHWSFRTLVPWLRRRAPELLALVATLLVYILIRGSVLQGLAPTKVDPSLEVVQNSWHRVLTALQAWPFALKVLVWPWTLLADYGPQILLPIGEWNSLAVLGATIVIALVGGGILALAKGYRVAALALLWYPVAILPVANFFIPIGVLLAERTLYLPSVALSFAVAALLTALARYRPDTQRAIAVALSLVIVLFAVRSMMRIPEWKSTDSILFRLVKDRPDAFRGQWHVARDHREHNRVAAALASYDQAFRLWPYREGLVQEVAAYASSQGHTAYARDVATFGAQRWPQNVQFYRLAVGNSLDLGDTATAARMVRAGLQFHPGDSLLNRMSQAVMPRTVP